MGEQLFDTINGKYRLIESVGGGAMGEVFKAEHIRMQKIVAIKILHSDVGENSEMIERFKREARAAAAIDHANICNVMDFDVTEKGDFYLVMEYLEGDTLKKRIQEKGKIPPNEAVFILLQLLSVLQAAHEKGIVHRDIKPDNIALLSKEGTDDFVKLLDFGIAHEEGAVQTEDSDEVLKTKMGLMYGTPEYIAPEQANGLEIDGRVDLYACGIILYEMLTGHVPFQSESFVNVIHQQLFAPPPHLDDPQMECMGELDAVIQKLLNKDRDKRYLSAEEVIRVLVDLPLQPFGSIPGIYMPMRSPSSDDIINVEALSKKSAEVISKARDIAQKGVSQFENSEFKAQSEKIVSQLPKAVKIAFVAGIAIIILLSLILIFTPSGPLPEIEIVKEDGVLVIPELKKVPHVQDYIYADVFDPMMDETLKNDPNIQKSFDYYKKKNEQLCYDYLAMVESRYSKHPNYLRFHLSAAAMLVRAKMKSSSKDSKYVDNLLLKMEDDFVQLTAIIPDAARNHAVTEALELLYPDGKKAEWSVPESIQDAPKSLAVGLAWAILYSPYDQNEWRKKRMFEVYDAIANNKVPQWQKQILEAWRLDKDKCKAREEIILNILDSGISKEEIYYGILSPLYQFLRLDVKAEYKRYQCKANFFQNRDCNYCMKNWIKDEYEKWTELFNQGKLNDASLDFVKELMNASNRERQ